MAEIFRPSWDEIWMTFAGHLSERSTCDRLHVGCVIVSDDNHRVLSMGYNGGAKGVFNACLSKEQGSCGHAHAELNALVKMDYNDPAVKKMYVTYMPCFNCSVLIVNSNVHEVVYGEVYRSIEGINLLKDAGILVRQVSI